MPKVLLSSVSMFALAIVGNGQLVAAQDSEVTESTEWALEEIVVSAQKRMQSINDVAVAITAFSGEALDRLGVKDPTELGDFTAGLSAVYNSVGAPAFTLRGVGLEDFIGNNTSGTAVYFDEVYPVSATQQGFQMYDVQRVEVLKGPQGTLYGRNSSGGAINFVPNRPTDEFEGKIKAGIDSFRELSLSGAVSGAVEDGTRARLSFNYAKGLDAWQDGQFGGADAGKADRLSARLQVEIDVSENITALVTVFGERDTGLNTTWQADDRQGLEGLIGERYSSTQATDEASLGVFFADVDGVASPENDTSAYGGTLRLEMGFDWGDVTSITNYQTMDRGSYDNNDGSPAALADFHFLTDVEQFSQELRLNRDVGEVGTVIVGGFYGWDSIDVNDVANITDLMTLLGAPVPAGSVATMSVDSTQKSISLGAYVHTEWQLSEKLGLTIGGRYTFEDRDFSGAVIDDQGFVFGAVGSIFPIFGEPENLDFSETENDFSYRVGLDFQVSDDILAYASLSTGFKSGVFYSGVVFDPRGWGYIEPEKLTAYEVGAKVTALDGLAQINFAAFYYDYKDKQTLVFIDDPFGAIATLGNVPESTVYGGELEITARPIQGLELSTGLSYLNAKVDVVPETVRGAALLDSIPQGGELTQAPSFSANFRADYTWSVGRDLLAAAQVSYSYSDKKSLFLSDPLSISDAYNSLGARVSVGDNDGRWNFAIYARNLTNERAVTLAFGNVAGNRTFNLQRPRLIGAEFTLNF